MACRQGTLTPLDTGSGPIWTCICSAHWDQSFSRTCRYFPDYVLRIPLGTFSILLLADSCSSTAAPEEDEQIWITGVAIGGAVFIMVAVLAFVYLSHKVDCKRPSSSQVFSDFERGGSGDATSETQTRTNPTFTVESTLNFDSRQKSYRAQPSAPFENPPSYDEAFAKGGGH